jgi:hypothetical protein
MSLLFHAAESAWSRGAHEVVSCLQILIIGDLHDVQTALKAFENIRGLLGDDHWKQDSELSLKVFLRLAE